jgi:protein phosphatase
VLGKPALHTHLCPTLVIRDAQSAAALEVMSRFAIDPRWLISLPPTMAPPDTRHAPDQLEDPTQVLGYYRRQGIYQVIGEETHRGLRAIVIICRDEATAQRRFGLIDDGIGIWYTRTSRRFFADQAMEGAVLAPHPIGLDSCRVLGGSGDRLGVLGWHGNPTTCSTSSTPSLCIVI